MGVTLSAFALLCGPAFAQGTGGAGGSGGGTGSGMGGGMGGGGGGSGAGMGNGTYTIQISPGVSLRPLKTLPDGRVQATRNAGEGNEHAIVDVVDDTVVVVYMSSNVVNGSPNKPSQVKCSSVKMNPSGAPTIQADQVPYDFTNDSNREGTPSLSCEKSGPNKGRCLVGYGANRKNGNNNTQTWGLVIDSATCKDLTGGESHHVRLNADQNNNEGAPRSVFDDQQNIHVFAYYSNNNNATYGELVQIVPQTNADGGTFTVKQLSNPQKLQTSNIGRASIVVMPGQKRALYAACKGTQRPCEGGNQVYYLNTDVNALVNKQMPVLWKSVLVQAKPDPNNIGGVDGLPGPLGGNGVYPARPQLTLGDNGEVHIISWLSNGAGRRRNSKGGADNHILLFKPDDTGPHPSFSALNLALESNHLGACAAHVGVAGSEVNTAAVFGMPSTAYGAASLSYIQHDSTSFSLHSAAAVSSVNADGAYLSNMAGENPNTQGGGHPHCVGDVPNVGYGVSGGFMPHVKSFVLAPWVGRKGWGATAPMVLAANGKMLPEDRNALYLTFVAGVRDAVQPAPPAPPAPPVVTNPGQSPGSGSGGNGNNGTPGTPGTPGSSGHFTSGCSVAVGGGESSTGGALILFGLALLVVARRRWS
jgi:MYXO-CTERM domain-containing protein